MSKAQPTNCADLSLLGHQLIGYYLVKARSITLGRVGPLWAQSYTSWLKIQIVTAYRQFIAISINLQVTEVNVFGIIKSYTGFIIYNLNLGYQTEVGFQDIGSEPTSCEEFHRVGNQFSAYYSVKDLDDDRIQKVYCDFSLSPAGIMI